MKKLMMFLVLCTIGLMVFLSSCSTNNNVTPVTTNETVSETSAHVHSFGEWITIKEPACAEPGEMERYCSCGEKQTQTIQAKGHSFGEWTTTKEPTCTETGEKERYCSCGEKQTQTIQAKGHSFGEWITTKEPTCTETGEKERYCSCGEKQTQTIQAKGHSFGAWITTKEPTCTETGEREHYCSCGEKQVETINAVGHKLSEWIIDKSATCASTGSKHRDCTVCGKTVETSSIPKTEDHVYNEGTIVTQPTCTESGKKEVTCTICNKKTTISIEPLGHDRDSNGQCKRCGDVSLSMNSSEKQLARSVKGMSILSFIEYSDEIRFYVRSENSNGTIVEAPAIVDVMILTDNGETLYRSQTLIRKSDYDNSEYPTLGVYFSIKYSEIKEAGTTPKGKIVITMNNSGYFSVSQSKNLSNIPYTVKVIVPNTPKTISEFGSSENLISRCQITDITYSVVNGDNLLVTLTGDKTYDTKGANYSRSCKIGWKLYDSEGYVLASGTAYTEGISTGEKFRNVTFTARDCIEPGKTYRLELLNIG